MLAPSRLPGRPNTPMRGNTFSGDAPPIRSQEIDLSVTVLQPDKGAGMRGEPDADRDGHRVWLRIGRAIREHVGTAEKQETLALSFSVLVAI
jgi:hypothetical protein